MKRLIEKIRKYKYIHIIGGICYFLYSVIYSIQIIESIKKGSRVGIIANSLIIIGLISIGMIYFMKKRRAN